MKTIKQCKNLWNYFSFCCWGGTKTRAENAWSQLEEIHKTHPFLYWIATIF